MNWRERRRLRRTAKRLARERDQLLLEYQALVAHRDAPAAAGNGRPPDDEATRKMQEIVIINHQLEQLLRKLSG